MRALHSLLRFVGTPAILFGIGLIFACNDSSQSGSTRARGLANDDRDSGRGPFVVFELPELKGTDYQVIGIQIRNQNLKIDLKKLYRAGTKSARELMPAGTHEYRIVYVNAEGSIALDSATCDTSKPYKEFTLKPLDETTIVAEVCAKGKTAAAPDISEFDRLHNPEYEGASWPPLPRRYLSLSTGKSKNQSMNVNLSVKLWDILSASTTVSTSLTARYSTEVTAIKHAPRPGTEAVIPGTSKLAVEPGIDYVVQCNYSGSISDTQSRSNGFSIGISQAFAFLVGSFGHDQTQTTSLEKATSIQAQSKLLTVVEGDTIESVNERCEAQFTAAVKEQVQRDVEQAARTALFADRRDNFQAVYDTAVFGPASENIAANGHSWNIDKAKLVHNGNSMTIAGAFERRVDFWFDDDFCYKITVEGTDRRQRPRITYQNFDNCAGSAQRDDWANAAQDIARNIAIEAWQQAVNK